jgi:hypothetical protein
MVTGSLEEDKALNIQKEVSRMADETKEEIKKKLREDDFIFGDYFQSVNPRRDIFAEIHGRDDSSGSSGSTTQPQSVEPSGSTTQPQSVEPSGSTTQPQSVEPSKKTTKPRK